MRATVAWAFLLMLTGASGEEPVTLYDPEPAHLWNRLHRALFIRTAPSGREFGHDGPDTLLRPRSTYLLREENRAPAVAVLREFIDDRGEKMVSDPARRALLQRDLWALFDWLADANGDHRPDGHEAALAELRELLGRTLPRLAIRADELRTLPDTYRAAVASQKFAKAFDPAAPTARFLPPDLLEPDTNWVCLSEPVTTQGRSFKKLVPRHVDNFSRSIFAVFFWMPDGRAATKAWLARLNSFATPWKLNGRRLSVHPDVPEFPDGTQVALLRCALVINDKHELVPTRIVESLQIRRFHSPASEAGPAREFVQEFVLTRKDAAGALGLRAIGPEEEGFSEFGELADEFEPQGAGRIEEPVQRVILGTCVGCHHEPGIRSFNTYTRVFSGLPSAPGLIEGTLSERGEAAVYWKQTRYDWGLLRGLMAR